MKKKPPQRKMLSDQLREALRNADTTRYAINKATGIDQSVLAKFLHGERGMSLPSIDLLADFLGLELVEKKRKG